MEFDKIGRISMAIAMASETEMDKFVQVAKKNGYKVIVGQAGSMDFKKIVAAIETASIKQGLITEKYWERHSLYHSILDAFHGICRGQLELGAVMRTLGVRFAVLRGKRDIHIEDDGNWVSVALYGTIGAPIKGCEHEVVGLGINHI
jgi:hut operon positive regulatory protein